MKLKTLAVGVVTLFFLVNCALASELSITIANAPREKNPPRFTYRNAASHFHVVLTNTSDKPVKIWDEIYSWGYYSLSFRGTDSAGHAFVAKRAQTNFTKNGPVWLTIESGGSYVFDVYFGDAKEWEGFPLPDNRVELISLSAVFEVTSTPESIEQHVWNGRVVSRPLSV